MKTSSTTDAALVHQDFMFLMAQINRQWRRVIDRQLRPRGMSEAMWLPLLHLARAGQLMRQKDLAASLSLDSSSVVRLLDGLESAGFIERMAHADRRAKTIALTPLGNTTVQELEALIGAGRASVLACVSEQALQGAFQVLQQLAHKLASIEQEML